MSTSGSLNSNTSQADLAVVMESDLERVKNTGVLESVWNKGGRIEPIILE